MYVCLHACRGMESEGPSSQVPYVLTEIWGEPPAKRMTGLFYPRSASLGLSGPGLSGPKPSLTKAFPEHFPMFFFVNSPSLPEAFPLQPQSTRPSIAPPKYSPSIPQASPRLPSFPREAEHRYVEQASPSLPSSPEAFPKLSPET